ncbi:MAG: YggS family pyridoxal phosphate-dependent enzyme [Deltaproteobacteria bacterium]|nr:YggS family pyridoxal phosphate-dependent enzyme [Deltaproteobacteria bacterium]
MNTIQQNVGQILSEIPANVKVVAAAKSRTSAEVREVIEAGITIIGENYLQESQKIITEIGTKANWHFIGHIQKNKVKYIVPLFDMVETVDTIELAAIIDKISVRHNKTMNVLIEINSARESQKYGVMPENAKLLIEKICTLENIKIQGLMTMGPFLDDPEGLRIYFRQTKALFEEFKNLKLPNVEMRYLSMGMSDSYLIAIEEGANMVRIGTKIFGPRSY